MAYLLKLVNLLCHVVWGAHEQVTGLQEVPVQFSAGPKFFARIRRHLSTPERVVIDEGAL